MADRKVKTISKSHWASWQAIFVLAWPLIGWGCHDEIPEGSSKAAQTAINSLQDKRPEVRVEDGDGEVPFSGGARGEVGQLCVISHFTDEIRHYANFTVANHARYTRRHGYFYHSFIGHLSGKRFLMPGHEDNVRRDGLYWQSFVAIEQALSWEKPSSKGLFCDWVLWIDADAIFTDFDTSVEQLLADWQGRRNFSLADKDLILSREEIGGDAVINAGVMLIRNSERGRYMLHATAARFEGVKDTNWADQRALHDYAFSAGTGGWWPNDFATSRVNLRPEIEVLPQRAMNSFAECPEYMRQNAAQDEAAWAWQPGDFVAHYAGWKQDQRVERMCERATASGAL